MHDNIPTTGQVLGAFRTELMDQGFTEEQAFALSRDALKAVLVDHGRSLVVKQLAEVL